MDKATGRFRISNIRLLRGICARMVPSCGKYREMQSETLTWLQSLVQMTKSWYRNHIKNHSIDSGPLCNFRMTADNSCVEQQEPRRSRDCRSCNVSYLGAKNHRTEAQKRELVLVARITPVLISKGELLKTTFLAVF